MPQEIELHVQENGGAVELEVEAAAIISGIPKGGTAGQVLTKKSDEDFDTEWDDVPEPSVPVTDVQINGASVVSGGVANVPLANSSTLGVVKSNSNRGIGLNSNTEMYVICAPDANCKAGNEQYKPIVPYNQHSSAFYGLAKAAGDSTQSSSSNSVGTYTESAKSAISEMLNGFVSVSGTTPSITAKPGIRYVCGECATLTITVPATGIIDVVFTSGSTPTVLTVTPPSGVAAVKWAGGFDPSSLDADTTYEINIADGEFGVSAAWT